MKWLIKRVTHVKYKLQTPLEDRWVITQTIQNKTGCYAYMETSLSKVKQNVPPLATHISNGFWFVRQRLRKDSSLSALSEVHWTNSTCLLSLSSCPCQALLFALLLYIYSYIENMNLPIGSFGFHDYMPPSKAGLTAKDLRFFLYFLKWYFCHRIHLK